MGTAGQVLEQLQRLVGIDDTTIDAVVDWACAQRAKSDVRARLMWALLCLREGVSLSLDPRELEQAFTIGMSTRTA
jgi:hypothetical protein